MRVIGLFAGIGGFEQGLQLAGHETKLLCELDEDARGVLERRFDAPLALDIRGLRSLPRGTDLVAAGFPCQDLSQAGLTAGIEGAQSRLIDVVFELLKRKPRVPWVVLENVPNMLRLQRGRGIRHVTSRLQDLGYSWAYRVVDTRAFGLPQRRQRVFVVASRDGDPGRVLFRGNDVPTWPTEAIFDPEAFAYGFYWTEGNRGVGWAREAIPTLKGGSGVGIPSPPAIWLPGRAPHSAFLVPGIDDAERLQGFSPGWTRPSREDSRAERQRWRLVGNAVTVPVAEWIGRGLLRTGPIEPNLHSELRRDQWPVAAQGGPGAEPVRVDVSTWPVTEPRLSLSEFLNCPTALSMGAALGFFERLQRSTLIVGPPAFRRALAQYCTYHGISSGSPKARPKVNRCNKSPALV